MSSVLKMASLQLQNVLSEPLVIIIALILIALSVLNGAASARQVYEADLHLIIDGADYFFLIGVSNALYHTSILLSALSMFIGALVIAEEKANGSLNVLNAKPVYKRDVYMGKFVGISMFLLLLTTVIIMLTVATLVIFYRGPHSAEELYLRMASYIVVISLSCILTLGIAMFIGVWLNRLLTILICTGTFLCVDWFLTVPKALATLKPLVPTSLFIIIIEGGSGRNLLNTAVAFSDWLNGALPYIIFITVEIVLIGLISCYAFGRSES